MLCCLCGCANSRSQASSLPKFIPCKDNLRINDPISGEDRNFLRGKVGALSYAYTYTLVHHRADSLGRETIRHKNARLARTLVSLQFPDIELVTDSTYRNMNYNGIMFPLSYIKSQKTDMELRRQMVDKLSVPSLNNRQLFIEVRSYMFNRSGSYIRLYIFDTADQQLLYVDELYYDCDIRDEKGFIKALQYGLAKLANLEG